MSESSSGSITEVINLSINSFCPDLDSLLFPLIQRGFPYSRYVSPLQMPGHFSCFEYGAKRGSQSTTKTTGVL